MPFQSNQDLFKRAQFCMLRGHNIPQLSGAELMSSSFIEKIQYVPKENVYPVNAVYSFG